MVLFYMAYISKTQKVAPTKLKKILEETKIDGGEMMQTLAQQWIREGKRETEKKWKETEKKWKETEKKWKETEKKWKEEKREMATRMLFKNYSVNEVMAITGLTEKEIQSLMN